MCVYNAQIRSLAIWYIFVITLLSLSVESSSADPIVAMENSVVSYNCIPIEMKDVAYNRMMIPNMDEEYKKITPFISMALVK